MDDKEIVFLVLSASITILLISIGLMFFLLFFVRTKEKNTKEQFRLKQQYEKELFAARIEIKDQTLQQVGRELHDNIGQLLTVTRIHIKGLIKVFNPEKLDEINHITGKALDELRALSRSLNKGTYGNSASLAELVRQEALQIEKTGVIRAHVKISGNVYNFDADHEVICFRIMQEFVSNALKYSGCENIWFELDYKPGLFDCCVRDDGKGFSKDSVVKGSGLINIENRARMIGAEYELKSMPGKGTRITLQLKTQHESL